MLVFIFLNTVLKSSREFRRNIPERFISLSCFFFSGEDSGNPPAASGLIFITASDKEVVRKKVKPQLLIFL